MADADPLETLLSIGSDPLSATNPAVAATDGDERSLGWLLQRRNGFHAFESALHVFPSDDPAVPGRSLEEWNDSSLWKGFYGDLAPHGLCFAEDVFGGQFVLVGSAVHTFDPETAELAAFADSVAGWAAKVLERYDFATGHSIAHAWQRENGALPVGHRLVPRLPFVVGGKYEIENMVLAEASAAMKCRARFATAISELADGTRLRFDPRIIDSIACVPRSSNGSGCRHE